MSPFIFCHVRSGFPLPAVQQQLVTEWVTLIFCYQRQLLNPGRGKMDQIFYFTTEQLLLSVSEPVGATIKHFEVHQRFQLSACIQAVI